jgi:hypothetical protein
MDKCSKCEQVRSEQERFCTKCGTSFSPSRVGLIGRWMTGCGCVFALFPIVVAILSTGVGGNPFSTASGGGAALYLLMLTFPIGAVISIVGLVLWLTKSSK